eukprot:765594-Hanusia_phi.AAC.3
MSRRPPSDTYESAFPSKEAATPQRYPVSATYPAPRVFQGPFQTYRSPFEAEPARPGMSALVDFKEGIEIVEDEAPEGLGSSAAGPDFMDYNGRISGRPIAPFVDDDEAMDEAYPHDVSVTTEDIRSMVEDNLRRNAGIRRAAAPKPTMMAGEALQRKVAWDKTEEYSELKAKLERDKKAIDELRKEIIAGRSTVPVQASAAPVSSPATLPTSRTSRLVAGSLSSMIRAPTSARRHANDPAALLPRAAGGPPDQPAGGDAGPALRARGDPVRGRDGVEHLRRGAAVLPPADVRQPQLRDRDAARGDGELRRHVRVLRGAGGGGGALRQPGDGAGRAATVHAPAVGQDLLQPPHRRGAAGGRGARVRPPHAAPHLADDDLQGRARLQPDVLQQRAVQDRHAGAGGPPARAAAPRGGLRRGGGGHLPGAPLGLSPHASINKSHFIALA